MEEINLSLSEPKLNVINSSDNGTIKISVSDPPQVGGKRSVNFGPGAEMLMNPNKQKQTSPRSDINLNDLNSLDNINLDEITPKKKDPVLQISEVIYLINPPLLTFKHLHQ